MNKHGIALAADSAVSISDGQKVYHTAEKLFKLSNAPIAIMTYGCAEIMGVPWEIAIKTYVKQFGERRFPTVEQYALDFLRFIETSEMLFPVSVQDEWFSSVVESVLKANIRDQWKKKLGGEPKSHCRKAASLLLQTIKNEITSLQKILPIEQLDHAFGEKVISDHAEIIQKLQDSLFQDVALSDEISDALNLLVKLLHTRQWFHPDHFSGMVFAGFGEPEPFPSLYIYSVGTVVSSKLRWAKADEAHVDRKHPVIIIPFAQTDMIDLFCSGIHPTLKDRLADILSKHLPHPKGKAPSKSRSKVVQKDVMTAIEKEFQVKYTLPLISAVEVLSCHDLAKMAEALVSLTAFKARMSVEQQETVGGPIDVAIIAKCEGFTWVKRKDMIKHGDATAFLMP
ncbi:hypothetical protein [Methylocystis sp. ATCC 49242]|uniref:hypothetical protein n=1 Tax=Methylocystis sp. ATCC 49242 TaxID=622637 RepID=UPI0001F8867E|nr:hypothetical protein [Methylocystis sp. ATCC 49242]